MGYSPPKCSAMFQNKHTFKQMHDYLNVYMTNSDPESSPTLSHSPKPHMRIIVLLVCGQPSNVYISIGPLRRLIYYLFVDYPPMNINWAAPMIDIFKLDYPPIINIF